MSGRYFLLKQFLRHPVQVGAIAPSGRALCRELVNALELENCSAVAELGPGTGVVSREIMSRCSSNTNFFAVELDRQIYDALRNDIPELKLFNADACDLKNICTCENIEDLDAVVAGLPWASLPEAVQQGVMDAVVKSLKKGGRFSTFAYLQGLLLPGAGRFRKLLEKEFSEVTFSRVIWKNLPPAVVYRCIK